jgi:septum site-determining protein MinD
LQFVRYCFIIVFKLVWGVCDLGEVISFISGKGGVGKSALCAGIATVLATSGRRVLCIDGDVGLRNLDVFLGISGTEVLSFLDVCSGNYPLSAATGHPKFPCLSFLTAPVNCSPRDIDPMDFEKMLQQARQDFDFVLLDGPAGIGDGLSLLCAPADRCVVVTLPDPASIRSADRCAQELGKMGAKDCKIVVNRLFNDLLKAMGKTIDDIMDEVGLPLLGIVPTDPNVSLAAAVGKPLIKYSHFGATAAYKRITKRILGLNVPISR